MQKLTLALTLSTLIPSSHAQTLTAPDWALPGSPTHKQVPPPAAFHRPSRIFATPIGIFHAQADIGSALVPSTATFNPSLGQYTITSAGYNIWYSRDEFRYLYNQMSGDISLAADLTFPGSEPPSDRKAVLILRQNLNDDSPEAIVAEHATGMVHLATRASTGANIQDMQFRFAGPLLSSPLPHRIGIEKHGDDFTLYVSLQGEPLHPFGPPIHLHLTAPFFVGIGFTSHDPIHTDTAILSNVTLKNQANDLH